METIENKKFGKWTVLSKSGRTANGSQLYSCQCECGFIRDHTFYTLRKKLSTQCKTCRMTLFNKVDDLTGLKFGQWQVIEKIKNTDRNEWFYVCKCDCGNIQNTSGYQLKSKKSSKCVKCRNKTHGMSNTYIFRIWSGILRRCFNKNFKAYKYYGGRGITVCERWLKFENFYEDMGDRPDNLQIDRIDNNGNYEPGNCRWVTPAVNNKNREIIKKRVVL